MYVVLCNDVRFILWILNNLFSRIPNFLYRSSIVLKECPTQNLTTPKLGCLSVEPLTFWGKGLLLQSNYVSFIIVNIILGYRSTEGVNSAPLDHQHLEALRQTFLVVFCHVDGEPRFCWACLTVPYLVIVYIQYLFKCWAFWTFSCWEFHPHGTIWMLQRNFRTDVHPTSSNQFKWSWFLSYPIAVRLRDGNGFSPPHNASPLASTLPDRELQCFNIFIRHTAPPPK